jgi:hypothetical protein
MNLLVVIERNHDMAHTRVIMEAETSSPDTIA